eukprot:5978211-Pyramimonas_sp.AAC.1
MERTGTFVPTLQTLQNARTGVTAWMPNAQDTGADATGPSLRGRSPVTWAEQLVARPARQSRSASRRNKICSKHPLSVMKPAAGQAETTGDERPSIMPLDFTA